MIIQLAGFTLVILVLLYIKKFISHLPNFIIALIFCFYPLVKLGITARNIMDKSIVILSFNVLESTAWIFLNPAFKKDDSNLLSDAHFICKFFVFKL